MRQITYVISLIGLLLFGGAFAWSILDPIGVERFAREAIKAEVQKRVSQRIDQLDDGTIGRLADKVLNRNIETLARVKRQIAEGLPQRIATEVGNMLDANCECRKVIGKNWNDAFGGMVASLGQANERLTGFIRGKYAEVAGHLLREFRIFTGANALVFALLGLVVRAKPKADLHLILPTFVLLGGAAVVAYFYLFQQNWLHAIVFSEYVGWWYLPWLAFVIAWLGDIVLNRGRVTVELLSHLPGGVMNGVSIAPC